MRRFFFCFFVFFLIIFSASVPYNQQLSNCCKGGVVGAWGQDPSAAVSQFQVSVGLAGTTNKTVKLPKNFTLLGPGPGYTCGPSKIVPSTVFLTTDKRRKTQALMTWNVTCTYSQFLARKHPSCCVSFSSFYNDTITPCPSCAMKGLNTPRKDNTPLLQCTHHMCPPPDSYPFLPNSAQGNFASLSLTILLLLFIFL